MNNYEIRYVFDIGSGGTKSMCCLVDQKNSQIIAILDQITMAVPYQKDISSSKDGKTLSIEMMKQGTSSLSSILEYYKINPKDAPIKCAGIATAWARNANNAQEYLDLLKDELGLHISVISQQEEGELGLKAVLANPGCPLPDMYEMLVWDVGGGSFQLSYLDSQDQINVYQGPYGAANFAQTIHTAVGCDQNQLLSIPQLIRGLNIAKKLVGKPLQEFVDIASLKANASNYVYAIGQFMNAGIKPMVYKDTISKTEILELMIDYSKHGIDELQATYPDLKPEFIAPQQTNLLLTYAIMDALEMSTLHFASNVQNLHAIAVEDNLWLDTNFADIWYGPEPYMLYPLAI